MFKLTSKFAICFALAVAFIAAFLVYQAVAGAGNTKQTVPVLVASQDIPPNTVISKDLVSLQDIAEEFAHPQALRAAEQAIGKTNKMLLLKGEQILTSKVASKEQSGNRFSYLIPDKQRAITMAVSEITGVAGYPAVGDRVDVILTREMAGTVYTSTMLQNKEIMATGSMAVPQEDGKQRIVPTITLSATPVEAQQLALAENTGKIKFTLRPLVDKEMPYMDTLSFKK